MSDLDVFTAALRNRRMGRGEVVALLSAIRRRSDLPPDVRAAVLAHANEMVARGDVARQSWHPRFVPAGPTPYTYAERDAARRAWARARRRGEVSPPDACACCDRSGLRLQGHHTDYWRPLDVLWLCTRCHGLAHGGPRPAHLAAPRAA
jgi:hypothetical protein